VYYERINIGFAYEDDKYFIHLYGYNKGFKGIAIDLLFELSGTSG